MKEAFLAAYLDAYQAHRPFAPAEIDPWLPLLAAARLNEQIAGEEAPLLHLVNAL
jgi:Ser/Thr protein kinase RdoA (MazF antagonist)